MVAKTTVLRKTPLAAVSMIERTVKSTSIANISKATTAFNMPPGEHSSSVEKFWLDPKPQFNDDTAPNVLELYITWPDGPLMIQMGHMKTGAHRLVAPLDSKYTGRHCLQMLSLESVGEVRPCPRGQATGALQVMHLEFPQTCLNSPCERQAVMLKPAVSGE